MKSVSISRHKLELARAVLSKPLITVGRSPKCDVVLRAPGIKAEHFHIKWNGVGDFDPTQDKWSLEDLTNGAASGTYLLSDEENICDGFAFRKDTSVYKSRPRIGGSLLRELGQGLNEETQVSKSRDLEVVWMGSRGAIKEVLHLNLKDVSGHMLTPLKNLPSLKVMGIEDPKTSKAYLQVFTSALKEAVALINGVEVSLGDVVLKDNQTLKLSWGKEMVFLRMVSQVVLPKEKSKRAEPLLFISSVLGTLFLASLLLLSGGQKNNVEVAKEEPQLIKIEIPAEEAPVAVAPSAVAEEEKSISLSKPLEVPVSAESAPRAGPAKKTAASGAAPSSGMKGGGSDLSASKVLSLLSKNKLAKGAGIMAKDVLNAEVPSETLASQNENAAVMVNRIAGGILNNKGRGGAPDGTGKDTGLVAAASTSRLNVEPGATSIGKVGTLGNGKGASFAKVNGSGNGRGTGAYGSGTGNALFGSRGVAVVGGLDRETVRRVIAGQKGKVQVCYDKALVLNPEIGGRIVYKWKIQPSGNVSTTAITKSQVASRVLEGCVQSVIKDMLFPKALNGAITTVIYPFEFFAKN